MKIVIEVELGNEAMQTLLDVRRAVDDSLTRPGQYDRLLAGEEGVILDFNGNSVGRWEVTASQS